MAMCVLLPGSPHPACSRCRDICNPAMIFLVFGMIPCLSVFDELQFGPVCCACRHLPSAHWGPDCYTCAVPVSIEECTSLWNLAFGSYIANGCARRAEDYWRGYKLFCFAYYSHSLEHVWEFRESKLGACASSLPCCLRFLPSNCNFASKLFMGC